MAEGLSTSCLMLVAVPPFYIKQHGHKGDIMKTIQLTDAQIYHLRHAIEYYKTGQDDLLEQNKKTLAFNKKHYPNNVDDYGYKIDNLQIKQWIRELVGCQKCLDNVYDKLS